MENTTATTAPTTSLATRLPLLCAAALFAAYSALVTTTDGSLSAACSPMLIAAIAIMVWHDDKVDGATKS